MNFLIIIADDLGWNDVGYHGGSIFTPNIDNLALTGIQLNQFYAHPICTPTRAALLTGRYPFRYGLQRIIWPWNQRGLSLDEKLLPEVLRENGYSTYAIGKWNLGHWRKEYLPTNRGFDKHYGNYTGAIDHYNHTYHGVHDFHENGSPIYPQGHACDLNTAKACEWIENHDKTKPFFMYLAYNSPHLPLQAPDFYYNLYPHVKTESRRQFCGMVSHLDTSVGKVVESLKRSGNYENTLIWFLSDNGGWTWKDCGGDNGQFRGGKVSCYEGGVRVVSFVHYNMHSGVYAEPCHVTDILPTILGLANIQSIGLKLDGFNIANAFLHNKPLINRKIVHELFAGDNYLFSSMTKGFWKIIIRQKTELYNLEKDPREINDLADSLPSICQELKKDLLEVAGTEYLHDPVGVKFYDYSNGGPLKGYNFPKYWGEEIGSTISMLKLESMKENLQSLSDKEIYGYPKDWEAPH